VNGEDANEKHDCHGNARERDERADQDGEAPEEFDKTANDGAGTLRVCKMFANDSGPRASFA
jgi:hypothetical protein